ncbi:hypothetical protein JCM8097_001116 [Rhodosporidiobolus ruineniae]
MAAPYGTPSTSRSTRDRPTQPPLGPSLSTPHRSPYPTSLRPSLFHARPSPLAATTSISPDTALATQTTYGTPRTVVTAGRLHAPHNTPASAYSVRSVVSTAVATTATPLPLALDAPRPQPSGRNPYDVLPASAFDSFVSSLTTSIRSALAPPDVETPSQRRRREREERAREREEAQRARAEAARLKEEERERKEREEMEQDVFGEILAVGAQEERAQEEWANGGPYERDSTAEVGDVKEEDFADRSFSPDRAPSTVYDPLPTDLSLRSTPADYAPSASHSRTPSVDSTSLPVRTNRKEDDEILLLSSSASASPAPSPVKKAGQRPLFVPRAPESATDEEALGERSFERYGDGDEELRGREGTWDENGTSEREDGEEERYEDAPASVEEGEEEQAEEEGEEDDYLPAPSTQFEYSHPAPADDAHPAPADDAHPAPSPSAVADEDAAQDDPSTYAAPFGRGVRYQFGGDEEGEVEYEYEAREEEEKEGGWEGEVDEAEMEWAGRGEDGGEGEGEEYPNGEGEVEEQEGEEEEEEERSPPETIEILDSSDEDEAGDEPAEEESVSPPLAPSLRLSPAAAPPPSQRRATYSRSPSFSPPPTAATATTDLSDRQLEAQLVAEAHRHNALPRDTPDAPDRMVEVDEGGWAVQQAELAEEEGSRSPEVAFEPAVEELDEQQLVKEAHRHNAVPRDTPDAPDRMVDVDEGGWAEEEERGESRSPLPAFEPDAEELAERRQLIKGSPPRRKVLWRDPRDASRVMYVDADGIEETGDSRSPSPAFELAVEEVEEAEDEAQLVVEAHRHNALPRDTPDAPDRMVEEVQGSYPLPGAEEQDEEVEDEDVEMQPASSVPELEPEGQGDADSAILGDVETDGDFGDADADASSVVMGSMSASVETTPQPVLPPSSPLTAPQPDLPGKPTSTSSSAANAPPPGAHGPDADAFVELHDESAMAVEVDVPFHSPPAASASAAPTSNPLEALYADEDSEDLLPRIPAAEKGKARAVGTPSDQVQSEQAEDGDSNGIEIDSDTYAAAVAAGLIDPNATSEGEEQEEDEEEEEQERSPSPTSSQLAEDLEAWTKAKAQLDGYETDDLRRVVRSLEEQLERAVKNESKTAELIVQQLIDTEGVLRTKLGIPSDTEMDAQLEGREGSGEELPGEEDFDSGDEGGEHEPIMPSELHEEDENEDDQPVDRSAFSDNEEELAAGEDDLAIDAAIGSAVSQLVSGHDAGQPSELHIPSTASLHPDERPATASSHFQLEPGSAPDFDSHVNLPVAPTETKVDAPLESQERNQDESVSEAIEEAQEVPPPTEGGQDISGPAAVAEQADVPAGPAPASTGLQVVDDDEPIEPASSLPVEEEQLPLPPPPPPAPSVSAPAPPAPTVTDEAVSSLPSPPPESQPLPHAVPASDLTAEAVARNPSPSSAPDPIVPVHALQDPLSTLSSQFQLEPGPAPDFDSPVRLPPVPTITREVDALNSDEERERDEEQRRKAGEQAASAEQVPPLQQLVDASTSAQREAQDFEQPPVQESGLMVVDDDEEDFQAAQTASDVVVETAPPAPASPQKRVLGATPPPADAESTALTAEGDQPPIIDGVAPPQNLDLVPEPLPASPVAASLPLSAPSPAPASAPFADEPEPTAALASESAAEDKIPFEDDTVMVDNAEDEQDELDEEGDESGEIVLGTPGRVSPSSVGGVLGLGADEAYEVSTAPGPESDDEDEGEQEAPKQNGAAEKEAEELVLSSSDAVVEEAAESVPPAARETAPSSEPIDYRSEDERAIEAREVEEEELAVETEPAVEAEEPRQEQQQQQEGPIKPFGSFPSSTTTIANPPSAHIHSSPISIKNVVDPGEWHAGEPIRFGGIYGPDLTPGAAETSDFSSAPEQTATMAVEHVSVEPVVELATSVEPELRREESAAVETDAEGRETILPTEVESVRAMSVATADDSTGDIAIEYLDSSASVTSARTASPAPPFSTTTSNLDLHSDAKESPSGEATSSGLGLAAEQDASTAQDPLQALDFAAQPATTTTAGAADQDESQDSTGSLIVTDASLPIPGKVEPAVEDDGLSTASMQTQQPASDNEESTTSDGDSDEEVILALQLNAAPSFPLRAQNSRPAETPRRRSARFPQGESTEPAQPTPPSTRRTRSTTAKEPEASEEQPSALPKLDELAPASPARRSSRLSAVGISTPAPTPSSSLSKPKRARKADGDDEPPHSASPAKRTRHSAGPSKLRNGGGRASLSADEETTDSDEENEIIAAALSTPALRLHHHNRHQPQPAAASSSSAGSSKNGKDGPITRSHCQFKRLRIRSRESANSPPYTVNVPGCALMSTIAQETMTLFGVEDLGTVEEDDCVAVPVSHKNEEEVIPDADVVVALHRIAGELYDEGVVEVLPREGAERRAPMRGKRRATGEEEGSSKAKKRK